jgi:hypothetical protein
MKYRIEKKIIVDNPKYGALGDDFSFEEIEAIDIVINKIEKVLFGKSEFESIYGNMCYQIKITKEISSIYCYDEFLGEESTVQVYSMFKEYRNSLSNYNDKLIL